jgi:hypothetical protein
MAGALAGWVATSSTANPIAHAIATRPSLRLETARAGTARGTLMAQPGGMCPIA